MVDSTPDIKDLQGSEILSDVPDLFAIAIQAKTDFADQALPTTALGWVTRLGFSEAGPIGAAAKVIDSIHAGPVTFDLVAQLLGLNPNSVLGKAEALAVKVIAQAND